MTGFFVRHRGPCGGKVFDPLPVGHPCLELDCYACGQRFEEGDRLVLVPLGPGADFEEYGKAHGGAWYNASAAPIHAYCAGQQDEAPAPTPDLNRPL